MRLTIVLIATFFGLWETGHFGWNEFPLSDAEVICDGITCLIFALAFVPSASKPTP